MTIARNVIRILIRGSSLPMDRGRSVESGHGLNHSPRRHSPVGECARRPPISIRSSEVKPIRSSGEIPHEHSTFMSSTHTSWWPLPVTPTNIIAASSCRINEPRGGGGDLMDSARSATPLQPYPSTSPTTGHALALELNARVANNAPASGSETASLLKVKLSSPLGCSPVASGP